MVQAQPAVAVSVPEGFGSDISPLPPVVKFSIPFSSPFPRGQGRFLFDFLKKRHKNPGSARFRGLFYRGGLFQFSLFHHSPDGDGNGVLARDVVVEGLRGCSAIGGQGLFSHAG